MCISMNEKEVVFRPLNFLSMIWLRPDPSVESIIRPI